jgi:hypothetical protein
VRIFARVVAGVCKGWLGVVGVLARVVARVL